MQKMDIAQAADFFGVSKEAIHNRIRRGSLESVVENGVKMVLVDNTQEVKTTRKKLTKTTDDRYYKLLEQHNAKLQEKVERLEDETRLLRDQKEQMLIAERQKIEAIYQEKDEQLKNFFATLSSQFMIQPPQEETLIEEEVLTVEESVDAEIEEEKEQSVSHHVISLKKYLKKQNFSEKKRDKLLKRFKKLAKKDERVIQVGSKLYIDPSKFDYSDLMEK
jgi:DNA-binding transcriptional regulator PaaX